VATLIAAIDVNIKVSYHDPDHEGHERRKVYKST
jgi:hypothetical protein